jgi:hypothetical protein
MSMPDTDAGDLVLLETYPDLLSGRLAAARLESEGIPTRLEGEPLGPYQLTVGSMAVTRLWVAPGRLDEARLVLGEAEEPASLVDEVDEEGQGQEEPSRSLAPIGWVALVVAALLLARVLYWLF